jgi:hypothetical protein
MTTRHAVAAAACLSVALTACSNGDGITQPKPTVTIQPASAVLCVGDSVTFSADVRDANGQPLSGVALTWSSSAPDVIDIGASGVGHALRTGSSNVTATATAEGVTSNTATLDVPADLVAELVPDSLVLAPNDTMTLGVRLRRTSGGALPAHTPVLAPYDSTVASLDATGLVHAKAAGRAGLSVSACGIQGRGAVDVVSPSDAVSGSSYLWLSGPAQLRVRLPGRLVNFTRTGGGPAFQVFGVVGNNVRGFVYEDTVQLSGTGTFPVDSLNTSEVNSGLGCAPPRPFATYGDQAQVTTLLSLMSGSLAVTSFTSQSGYTAVSGRMSFRMRGVVGGDFTRVDTLTAIYTFSAPLVDSTGACP